MMDCRKLIARRDALVRPVVLLAALAAVSFLWSYWPTLRELAYRWSHDPQYSYGYLVPLFALVLLGMRWKAHSAGTFRPSWWGLPLILGSVLLRLRGAYYYYFWFDAVSLIPCLVGLCLLLGGWRALRWSWPALAFLVFMLPLPHRVEAAMGPALRKVATEASAYLLQTLGISALPEGNTILLEEYRIGIVEACSGLKMLMVFFALSTAVALVIDSPLWEKCLVVASAVPIALVANIGRITVTAILFEVFDREVGEGFFHDYAGLFFMMPLAVLLLCGELLVLRWLLVVPVSRHSRPIALWTTPASRRQQRQTGGPERLSIVQPRTPDTGNPMLG